MMHRFSPAVVFSLLAGKPRNLPQALAWLLVGALAPLLIGATLFLSFHWSEERASRLDRLRDLALALQLSVDRELALDQTALQVLASSPLIDRKDWAAFHTAATEAAKVRPGRRVFLGDGTGQALIDTGVPSRTPPAPSAEHDADAPKRIDREDGNLPQIESEVLAEAFRSGLPRVSNLFSGALGMGSMVALSVPVKRDAGVLYALAFIYPPETFVELLRRQAVNSGVVTLVVDGNGRVIARHGDWAGTIGGQAQPPFDRGVRSPARGLVETTTLEGVPAFFAYRKSGLTDWTLAVGVPRDDLLAAVRRSLVLWLALLWGMLLAAGFLARRFWRRVALPLAELAKQARDLGKRDIEMPPTGIDEVDTLCRALREAAAAERARRDEAARRLALEHRERLLASQHAEELAAVDRRKDEFLAMLGHELRNPLAPIMNGFEILRKIGGSADADARGLHGMMERQTRQLARLVDDLLDVARINTGKIVLRRDRVDLREVVEHAAQAAQPAMERRAHTLSVECSHKALWVDGDEARLAQVIGNLLENSAKYTPPGGKVTLSLSRDAASAFVRVADNGKGIPPELLPHVFDLFKQGDVSGARGAGGLGIGLHIVKRLVDKHGGEVSVSSPGLQRGSVFEVKLPLAAAPQRDRAVRPMALAQRARQLLVVDDNEDAAGSLAELLRLEGHTVRVAHDGEKAMEAALRAPPDAVLLDINMPGMDGYEVARRLRAEPSLAGTTLIALTGYGQPAQQQAIRQAGMARHLTKPVSYRDLQEVLATLRSRSPEPTLPPG